MEQQQEGGGEKGEKEKQQSRPKLAGSIQVNSRQRGNPVLKSIRSVPWEFVDGIGPDYVLGQRACAVFLSVRYHTLNPDYIHERLKQLKASGWGGGGGGGGLRVLLVQVDAKEPHHALKQLMRICILTEMTLMLAWSAEEAGSILEGYKQMENRPPDLIMEKGGADSYSKCVEALTTVRSVNKTDAATLLNAFGTMEAVFKASVEDLSLCPGFGPQKAHRLHKVLNEPFKKATNK